MWPVGQAVKTAASHAVNMGSIPVRVTKISGVDYNEDPPVPIPNTEVKLNCVDGTWRVTARESRTLPDYFFLYMEKVIFSHSSVGRASDC